MAEMGGLCASGRLWYYALTHGCLSSNVNADLNILFAFLPAIVIDKFPVRVLAVKLYQVSRVVVNVSFEGEQICISQMQRLTEIMLAYLLNLIELNNCSHLFCQLDK